MITWNTMEVNGLKVDIAMKDLSDSEWLVYADEKLGGGDYNPYSERVETLEDAKDRARELANSEHPNDSSTTLGYIEITEVHKNAK